MYVIIGVHTKICHKKFHYKVHRPVLLVDPNVAVQIFDSLKFIWSTAASQLSLHQIYKISAMDFFQLGVQTLKEASIAQWRNRSNEAERD